MRVTMILTTLNLVVWGLLILSGVDLVEGVAQRIAPSLPSEGQIDYYVIAPAVMFCVALACSVAAWRWRSNWWRLPQAVMLVVVLPYLLVYTGGV